MGSQGSSPRLHPRLVREFPPDLAACVVVTLLTIVAVTVPVVREMPLRVVLGLPFVLFVPGYAFIAALFPEAGTGVIREADDPDDALDRDGGIDGIERTALSFGLSIAIVPLIGLVLNYTPWGIRLGPILVGVGGFSLITAVVAAHRRLELPPEEQFRAPYRAWLAAGRAELFEPDSRLDAALNVLLVISVVLAASSVVYAVTVPKPGESFTEFYLLTETDEGDLVADDYPTNFTRGGAQSLVVGIENNEFEAVNYSVVVLLQNVSFDPGGEPVNATANATVVEVHESVALDRFDVSVGHNETWRESYTVRPTLAGDRLRLAFLLYRDELPSAPTVDNAYRELHLWVNVSQG